MGLSNEIDGISRSLTFTSPQTTENTVQMYSVNGTVRATNDITLSGVTYYRHFNQKHVDGNLFDDPGDCGDGTLCSGDDQVLNAANGQPIPFTDNVYGSIDKTSQNADGAGFTLQATDTAKLFEHKNQFVIGTSYDHGFVAYTAESELGFLEPKFVVAGQGVILSGTDDFNPRSLNTINDYYGIYFTDTLDITDQLALTVGGRYNYARIQIENTGDPENDLLNGVNHYHRFNPSAGLTYAFSPELNWYGGYSEANRAPTAAELACADPENPCLIESFLTADPHLKQVVSHTWEAGFRGTIKNWTGTRWDCRTLQPLPHAQYRRYFRCSIDRYRPRLFPERRQYPSPRCRSEHRLSHTQSVRVCQLHLHRCDIRQQLLFPSPNHPASSSPDLFACEGDVFKAGVDYWMTQKWKVGADVIAASDQIFFGDESNPTGRLPLPINLFTCYEFTKHVEVTDCGELFDHNSDLRHVLQR